MRILGIDPGSRLTGFGVLEIQRNSLHYLASGCIRITPDELVQRLQVIYDGIASLIDEHRPDVVAIEKVFVARNPDSALKLGQARGAALCAVAHGDLPVTEYSALQIKQAIVGRGHADKQQVQHMVKALLKLNGTPQSDAADALACAICHAHHIKGQASFNRGISVTAGSTS